MRDPVAEFQAFNRAAARRHPGLIRFKIARMAESPFAFFRGSFHLFARDLVDSVWPWSPTSGASDVECAIVGDIHCENFGTLKSADGIVHYDINDFDETTTGRFEADVCRLAVSHALVADEGPQPSAECSVRFALAGIRSYVETVQRHAKKGRDSNGDVSEKHPCGAAAVDAFVTRMAQAKRSDFIAQATEWKDGKRKLIRSDRCFNVSDDEQRLVQRLLDDYRSRLPSSANDPAFFAVEDVCGRVSGIGSMGRLRYGALLAGKGSRDAKNVLLEFKEAWPSAYDLVRGREQDAQAEQRRAEQVIEVQRRSQAAADPLIGWARDGAQSFQVRQRGPHEDRLHLGKLSETAAEEALRIQGAILARVHARSAATAVGPTPLFAAFDDGEGFCRKALAFALAYAAWVRHDWERFVAARSMLENVEAWAKDAK